MRAIQRNMETLKSKMDFVAIDVETANADMASICQIGVAKYNNGILIEEWSSLIDPEDYFDFFNVGVHGITEEDVEGKPTFPEIFNQLNSLLDGEICVSHTHFDRVSISRALTKYGLPDIDTTWLDSARVASPRADLEQLQADRRHLGPGQLRALERQPADPFHQHIGQ